MNGTADNLAELRSYLERLRRAHRRAAARLVTVRLLWVALALIAILLALDAMFPLPNALRALLSWSALAALLALGLVTWWRTTRVRALDQHLARRIEAGNTGLENDLINALEFSERLKRPTAEEAATIALMRRAVGRAVDEAVPIGDRPLRQPPTLRHERIILIAELVLFTLAGILCGDVLTAVFPRYLDPSGDHPPYSPTHFIVDPAGAQVTYGNQQTIHVRTTGVPASEAALVLENESGRELQRIPMFQTETGRFAQTVENIRQPLRYYIAAPDARSRRYLLTLNKTPRIESVSLRLIAPAYTHKPEQERQLSQPLIKGYAKSKAHLTIQSNRPLAGGELNVGGQVVALKPEKEKANSVGGDFELGKPGAITASVTDVEGFKSDAPWNGKIEIIPDEKPAIAITSPGMDSFAVPNTKVPIVIEANDDLGFRKVTLVRNVNGSKDFSKTLSDGDGKEDFVHATEMLDLADLGAQPGDVISYYATASDTNPEGAQTAATPSYQLAVMSFDEYRDFVRSQMTAEDLAKKYEQFQEKLERLAKEQEALQQQTKELGEKSAQGDKLTKDGQEQLAETQRRQQDLERQTRALADEMRREADNPPIFDVEKSFKQDLKEFADKMEGAGDQMTSASQSMEQAAKSGQSGQQGQSGQSGQSGQPGQAGQALQQAAGAQQKALDTLNQNAKDYKEGIESASQELARGMDLIGDVSKFTELYQRQKELERQTRLFSGQRDPSLDDRVRMKELAEEQNDIRQQTEQLIQDLRKHGEAVKQGEPKLTEDANKIADEMETRRIRARMQQAGERLDKADGNLGHTAAAEAAREMEAMINFCQGMGGEGGQCDMRLKISMLKRGMSMGETLAQMRANMGSSMGKLGARGQGSNGYMGSASQFGFFGPEQLGSRTQESKIVGSPSHAQAQPGGDRLGQASSIEELASERDEERKIKVKGGERVMEEYRLLIEAYFKGLAEEKR